MEGRGGLKRPPGGRGACGLERGRSVSWARGVWSVQPSSSPGSVSSPTRAERDSCFWLGRTCSSRGGRLGGKRGARCCLKSLFSSSPPSLPLLPAPRLRRVCFSSWIPLPFTSVRQTRANLPHSPWPQPDAGGAGGELSGQRLGLCDAPTGGLD